MSNYRADQLYRLIVNLDRRTQTDDDTVGQDENTLQETFTPISDKLALSDTVETAFYSPSTFVWGDGMTIAANWEWNYGGRWADVV